MTKEPELSVLIVNWNTRELTLACLERIASRQLVSPEISYEVIVVDNGSADGSAEKRSSRRSDDLRPDHGTTTTSASRRRSIRRIDRSTGELVLLLNSDVEAHRRGSDHARTGFSTQNAAAAAGAAPLYVNPDGTPQPFHFRFPSFATTLANASSLVRRTPPRKQTPSACDYRMLDDDFSKPRPFRSRQQAVFFCADRACRRDRVFDERYPIFFNDVQLARSLAAQGHALWVTPDAVVAHEAHSSTSRLGGTGRRQYLGSLIRMLEETEPPLKVKLFKLVILLQNLTLLTLHRSRALSRSEMRGALAGDPGPLPTRPSSWK